jgi:hypothetical protein
MEFRWPKKTGEGGNESMTGEEIVRQARSASKDFQLTSRKFSGAMTAELVKKGLLDAEIQTSARDVFIRGTPFEIDLIVPYRGEEPTLGLLYEPRQVAAALEIKKMGSFGKQTLQTIRNNFNRLRELKVACAYVTLEERKSFRYKATEENLGGFPCFTLAWHKVSDGPLEDTQDWDKLLTFLRKRISLGNS